MTLFDAELEDFELFCIKTRRIVYRQKLSEKEANEWSNRLEKSFCGHLKWQKASESKVRKYVVNK